METMPTPTFQDQPANEPSITPAEAASAIGRGNYMNKHLEALSDISRADARQLAASWEARPESERIALVRTLCESAEEHVQYLFGRVLRIGLRDASAVVRQIAISGLWEEESLSLIDEFIDLMEHDDSVDVRAESATALSRFVDLAAIEEIDEAALERLRETLLAAANSADQADLVRRRALESVAILGGDDVRRLIADAYDSDDAAMRASAIYAMGRSLDQSWRATVISELESDDSELRFEAARASGELGHADAVPVLAETLKDRDTEVRQAAITALGRIGGAGAVRVLRNFSDAAPAVDRELVDDALAEAQLFGGGLRGIS
jgi:HEAT repeat protein